MSNPQTQLSAQFEVLISSDQQSHQSQENSGKFVTLQFQNQQSFLQSDNSYKQLSYTIIEENTIVIIDPTVNLLLSQQQWQEFIKKKQQEIAFLVYNDSLRMNQTFVRLTIYQKNTIVEMKNDNLSKRKSFWNIANYNFQVEKQFQIKQQQSEKIKQSIITILSYELTQIQITSLRKNAFKINKVLKQIAQYKDTNFDALRIYKHEKELMQWIYDTLMRYALHDQQIRYCKGIQYVCLGIIVAYPEFNLAKYTQIFYHFMTINKFRQLYLEGCPKYFEELHNIKEYIKNTKSQLYDKIEEYQGDYKNLFISYFRSCLIYKLKNPEIIRKLFELLFVEGISIIKSIVLRVIEVSTPHLLKDKGLIDTLSSQLVVDYFQFHKNQKEQQQINMRIQRLFLI